MQNSDLALPEGPGSRPSDGAASVSTVPASIPNATERAAREAVAQLAGHPCIWAEDDVRVLAILAGNAVRAGLYFTDDLPPTLIEAITYHQHCRRRASGIEARRAATAQTGAVGDESPVAESETPNPGIDHARKEEGGRASAHPAAVNSRRDAHPPLALRRPHTAGGSALQ